ncbi:hypothetical protein AB0M20_21535, partial [Actinoplanes sp. NPDC051633]|uniref:hypothetical protein n=1 Tax=Actinoplanes sp. NPDC051633 TaxID=3155670 RepID=UPI0034484CFE
LRLLQLADAAVEAIAASQDRGEDIRAAVLRIVGQVFGSGTGGDQLALGPDASASTDERITSLVRDPRTLDRIVAEIAGILEGRA